MLIKLKLPIAIFVLALVVRGAVAYFRFDQLSGDPDAYARISETLADTGVYGLTAADGQPVPTAFRPPLYPYVLSWLVSGGTLSSAAVAVFHSLMGAMTALLAYLVFEKLAGSRGGAWSGILSAALVTIDPILVQQSTLVMTETLATALAAVIFWWWFRVLEPDDSKGIGGKPVQVLILGVLLAAAYLCRPTFLVWAILLSAAVALFPDSSWRTRLGIPAMMLLPIAITLALWTQRNQQTMGHPIWATTHGGYTLLLGNNPSFYQYLREGGWGQVWDAGPFLAAHEHRHHGDPNSEHFWTKAWAETPPTGAANRRGVSEWEDDRICRDAALATIRRDPSTFAWSCLVRWARLWSPFPHQTPGRSPTGVIAVGVYYVLLYIAVVVGLWRAGVSSFRRQTWHIWTLAITLSLVHAVYWSNIRMRAPIMPALAVFAAMAVVPRSEPRSE